MKRDRNVTSRNGHCGGWRLMIISGALFLAVSGGAAAQFTGPSPMFDLARAGDVGGIEYLLKKGYNIDSTSSGGETVLIAGATGGHVAVVELALAEGARVNRQDEFGRSALSRSAEGGHFAVVERLLAKRPEDRYQSAGELLATIAALA